MSEHLDVTESDVVLVGAGIMSTTLAVFLKELQPALNVALFETLESEALESSNAWNNAGTGHAALCELNYTPMDGRGNVEIDKALAVNVEFDLSRQLWTYLVKKGAIASPGSFIHPVPHMSFVTGTDNVVFLKKRHAALTAHHCYRPYGIRRTSRRSRMGPAGAWRAGRRTKPSRPPICRRCRCELRGAHPRSSGAISRPSRRVSATAFPSRG